MFLPHLINSSLKTLISESSNHFTSSTGLRRALRSRVSNDIGGGYLKDMRLNPSHKFSTLPRNYRRSSDAGANNHSPQINTPTQKSTTNKKFIETMTMPRRLKAHDSFESSFNTTLDRSGVESGSERSLNSSSSFSGSTLNLSNSKIRAQIQSKISHGFEQGLMLKYNKELRKIKLLSGTNEHYSTQSDSDGEMV